MVLGIAVAMTLINHGKIVAFIVISPVVGPGLNRRVGTLFDIRE